MKEAKIISDNKQYDNLIMSWSCFGDFVLISQSIKTLIDSGQVKRGVIITHEKSLRGLLSSDENIMLLYPNQNLKDFFVLLKMSMQKNIFIIHDMPSYNKFSKQIRLIMSIILTLRLGSKLFLLIDKSFKQDMTTKISKIFASAKSDFYINTKQHISQYIIDMLSEANIIRNVKCDYNIKLNTKEISLDFIKNDFRECLKLNEKVNAKSYVKENDLKDYIVIHPFASNLGKSLTVDWCVEFIKKINSNYPKLNILILGGPADHSKIDEVISNTKNTYNMSKSCSFLQSLYLIKNSKLSVNVPSGPAHFAAFFKVPQIVIWQENNTDSYIPTYNQNAVFVLKGKVYSAENVYEADSENALFLPDTKLVISELTKTLTK